MGIYVGKHKRYSEAEKIEMLNKSLNYPSVMNAAKNLGVCKETLAGWMWERDFEDKFYMHQAKKRYKKIREPMKYLTVREAALKMGLSVQTLYGWKKKYGIKLPVAVRKKKSRYSEQEKRKMAQRSLKYESTTKASLHLGVTRSLLIKCCKQFGVPVKHERTIYSTAYKQQAVRLLKNGHTFSEVAKELGIGRSTIVLWSKLDAEGKLK